MKKLEKELISRLKSKKDPFTAIPYESNLTDDGYLKDKSNMIIYDENGEALRK